LKLELQLVLLSTTSYKISYQKNPDTLNLTEKEQKYSQITSTKESDFFLFIILIKKYDKSNVFRSIGRINNHCLNVLKLSR